MKDGKLMPDHIFQGVCSNQRTFKRLNLLAGLGAAYLVFASGPTTHFAVAADSKHPGSEPIVRWDFGEEESTPLRMHGGVHRDVPGARSPKYPDFGTDNTAVKLDGKGAYLSFEDSGVQSPFDFTNGDEISIEAWVQVSQPRSGGLTYIIGKGRTGSKDFIPDNQNWALRLKESKSQIGISFLFATVPVSGRKLSSEHWHRWTSTKGFYPGPGWHHVAISYRFGDPKSIRGWIDGRPQPGVWDMGGETKEAPVVDDDAIWIGSSQGGSAGNSFKGSLDAIAIHRELLNDAVMKTRFRRVGEEIIIKPQPEVVPELEIPAGQTLITFHEGMPEHDRWLNTNETMPKLTLKWNTELFLLDRLPQRFDDWGIRADWKAPVLMRMATDAKLSPGKHRFLMRTRGLSRLWVNGKVIARSHKINGSPSGEEPVTPVTEPPFPGLRSAEHRQQENFAEAVVGADGTCRVILETFIGGARFRTDPGEICVAVETDDGSSFVVLQPTAENPVYLTDVDVEAALARQEESMQTFDDQRRRLASKSQDGFWKMRHDAAREWAAEHPAPEVPKSVKSHPIDAFLDAKIQRALTATSKSSLSEAKQFHQEVLPILRENCFRCHGDKVNGGLLLNSRENAMKGGDSGIAAVDPGHPLKSEMMVRIQEADSDVRMPPGPEGLKPKQIATLKTWIENGAHWPAPPVTAEDVAPPLVLDDSSFIRRLYLDTVGVGPSEEEVRHFLADNAPDKRERLVDRLLEDERWTDHVISYWQDILAENPTLINASLNTTGPFRWFLRDSFRDNKPLDRMITELILLRGSRHEGGSAGFGMASNNAAPFAAKGQIVASAFLGIELQCARCHDSPYHSTLQSDLYALAAMFEKKPVTVPKSSRVPAAFFANQKRESLIKVSLKPDEAIPPDWPFAEVTGCADDASLDRLMHQPKDTRERLATLITAPQNTRFAQVMVNRFWRRLTGAGIVEPPADWEGHPASHPRLLEWLAQELITHDYDIKHISRLILTSELYQRAPTGQNRAAAPELRFFVAPDRRRLSAEQIIDSLCEASGRPLNSEELTFDPDGRRASSNRLTLGVPTRAWMMASLANERDRPSLGLPRARTITDIMQAFGWTGSRQNPRTDRETAPSVLQPGVLANSIASVHFTRASQDSGLADLAVEARSPAQLVDSIFLRFLSRLPTEAERAPFVDALSPGFDQRLVPADQQEIPKPLKPLPKVTWSNHLRPKSNSISLKMEDRARTGPPADPRLQTEWREIYEDVVWSVINISEFVWVP